MSLLFSWCFLCYEKHYDYFRNKSCFKCMKKVYIIKNMITHKIINHKIIYHIITKKITKTIFLIKIFIIHKHKISYCKLLKSN